MTRRTSQNTKKRNTRHREPATTETSRESRRSAARSQRSPQTSQSDKSRTSSSGRSTREERKRQRTKARADKMFDRQVAISSAARNRADDVEGAPRAALYEGKMGSTHRKSARMQRVSEAGPSSAKINPAGWFNNIPFNPRALRVATAALCIALVAIFLYVPAQQYYQAQREHERLAAEYAVVEQRNGSIDFENDSLASDAGMEDAVREKYGYIVSGEETAVVTGLSDKTLENVHGTADVEGNVLSSSVKAPEHWYTPLLDAFFGVE